MEVQTNEEAQVYVHDLHIFVTVQLLKDTPAVLSLRKVCKEHGDTYEWPSGREPRLTKKGKQTFCKTEFVPRVVPGLSSSSTTTSSSTSPPQDLSISLDPANTRNHEGLREPVAKKLLETGARVFLNGWRDFTENLKIVETPAAAEMSHDSDPERPLKVASRKHSIYAHISKDRTCEVCKRTKITKAPCRMRTRETARRADKFGESDISPVPVSTTVDERSGRPDVNHANKNPKTNKKGTQEGTERPVIF